MLKYEQRRGNLYFEYDKVFFVKYWYEEKDRVVIIFMWLVLVFMYR